MKRVLFLGLVMLVGACSTMSQVLAPEVRILRADGEHVVLYDENNNINKNAAEKTAGEYCGGLGKTSRFESQGGNSLSCVSNQLRYCLTYVCEEQPK